MGIWDTYQYDIREKLPEWWKDDAFLEPINRYSQQMIKDMVGGLLSNIGIVQPVQVWKTLPTEYSWTHTYVDFDERLLNESNTPSVLKLQPNKPLRAILPDTKRNHHAVIHLKLIGTESDNTKHIEKLTIKNAGQIITLNNIQTTTDIKIFTEDNNILVDNTNNSNLVTGSFNKIYPQAKNTNYDELDIDDPNQITYIEIESSHAVNFKLQIKLIHPVYVTEQNIRLHTVSAFPLEWVKLYGFYCHNFNNKQEWRFLWEKSYEINDRVVFDRITKQFNCEIFYVQVKLHGIGQPLAYGFPQEPFHSNPIFQTNLTLDKWGKLLGLPRRHYKTNISDEEEPYTFPPFYAYDIEQDYWFEERLVNEYRYNEDAINTAFVKDTNQNNIALLKTIDPFIRDVYVYTETIKADIDTNERTEDIYPTTLSEDGEGITWDKPYNVAVDNYVASELILEPKTSATTNNFNYQSKILIAKFDIPELPKNIVITGLEIDLQGVTTMHSNKLVLDDRSQMILKKTFIKNNGDPIQIQDNIQINNQEYSWELGAKQYVIGGKNDLFGMNNITREDIEDGLEFHFGFTNTSPFLKANIILYGIRLIIHYKTLNDTYTFDVHLDSHEIVLNDPSKQSINMTIDLKNIGEVPIINRDIYIATPPELNITYHTFPLIDLDVGELFTVGAKADNSDKIIITTNEEKLTGTYDIIIFCSEKVIKEQITVREGY